VPGAYCCAPENCFIGDFTGGASLLFTGGDISILTEGRIVSSCWTDPSKIADLAVVWVVADEEAGGGLSA
jgi:hypothetical protein